MSASRNSRRVYSSIWQPLLRDVSRLD